MEAREHKERLKTLLKAERFEFDAGGARVRFTMGRDRAKVMRVANAYLMADNGAGDAPRKAVVTWACAAYWELAAEAGRDGAVEVKPLPVPVRAKK